jgi:hypothetical protein
VAQSPLEARKSKISEKSSGGSLGAMGFECVEEIMDVERQEIKLLIGLVYLVYCPVINRFPPLTTTYLIVHEYSMQKV